jgi:uncharacterized protein (DUF433 family)
MTTEVKEKILLGTNWIVSNPDRFGGKPTVRGTRFSVSFILNCLADGMTYEDIVHDYSEFPKESITEILRFAAAIADQTNVAA